MSQVTLQFELDSLRELFQTALNEQEAFEQSWDESLDEVERYCGELDQTRSATDESSEQLAREVESLREEKDSLAVYRDEQQAQIEQLREQLEEARGQLAAFQDGDGASASEIAAWEEKIQQLEADCRTRTEEREQMEQQLQQSLTENSKLKEALESMHDGLTADLEARLDQVHTELDSTKSDLDQRDEEMRELVEERASLEGELEAVRAHAAEISEMLTKERKLIAEDRAEWSNELKQLRGLLERQPTYAHANTPTMTQPVPSQAGVATASVSSQATQGADPVVGSVMAQFDRIRQQRAEHK